MPHVIYLHSALTDGRMPCRDDMERQCVLRFERLDVIIALGIAGLVNMAMLAMAAKLFHIPPWLAWALSSKLIWSWGGWLAARHRWRSPLRCWPQAPLRRAWVPMPGRSSWPASSIRVPLLLRRAITMTPAIIILAIGISPTEALVLSQVVLSFGIPFALVPLIMLTSRRDIMGIHVNHGATTAVAWTISALVIALNAVLLYQQFCN